VRRAGRLCVFAQLSLLHNRVNNWLAGAQALVSRQAKVLSAGRPNDVSPTHTHTNTNTRAHTQEARLEQARSRDIGGRATVGRSHRRRRQVRSSIRRRRASAKTPSGVIRRQVCVRVCLRVRVRV
jgi:hypothetical protein